MKYKIFAIFTFIIVLVFAGVSSTSVERPVEEKDTAYWVTDEMQKAKFNLSLYMFNGVDYVSMKLIVPEAETISVIYAPAGYYFNDDTNETNVFELLEHASFEFVETKEDVTVYYLPKDSVISVLSDEGNYSYMSTDVYEDDLIHWSNITSVECSVYYSTENITNNLDPDDVVEVELTAWEKLAANQLLSSVVTLIGIVGGLTMLMVFTKHRYVKSKES